MPKTAVLGTVSEGTCLGPLCWGVTRRGKVITSSEDTFAGPDGKGVARKTDLVQCDVCLSTGELTKCSSTVFVNGLNRARIGDEYEGVYSGTLIEEPVDTIEVGG